MRILLVILVAALLVTVCSCGEKPSPEDTAAEFIEHIQDNDFDGARELLAEDQWDRIRDFCDEEKEITGYRICEDRRSEDGCKAVIEWHTNVIDENSPDTNEGGEWLLEKDRNGYWIITSLFPYRQELQFD